MTNFEKIKYFIDNNPDLCFLGYPASDDLIKEIENKLNVRFPNEYRILLKEWGSVVLAVGRYRYDGIRVWEGKLMLDVIDYTMRCREYGLPDTYFAFSSIDGDEYLCMDTSSNNTDVLFYDPFEKYFPRKLATSLFDAIYDDIETWIIPNLKEENRSFVWFDN
jgi:hypothetical protein